MFRLAFFIFFSSVCISASSADNTVFWQKRLNTLTTASKIYGGTASPLLSDFFKNESLRCKEAVSLYKTLADNPDSLIEPEKTVFEQEIRAAAETIAQDWALVYSLDSFSHKPSFENRTTVLNLMKDYIAASLNKKGIEPDNGIVKDIISLVNISDKESASLECAFKENQIYFSQLKDSIMQQVNADVSVITTNKTKPVTSSFLEETVRKAAETRYKSNPPYTAVSSNETLETLASGKTIRSLIDGEIAYLAQLKECMGRRAPQKGSELKSAALKKTTLDRTVFSALTEKLCDMRPYKREKRDGSILALPREPETAALFSSIDALRRKALQRLGSENDNSALIAETESSINILFNDAFKDSAEAFFKENEKNKMLSSDNDPAFATSRDIFITKRDGAKKYCTESIAFLKTLSHKKVYDPTVAQNMRINVIRSILSRIKESTTLLEKSGFKIYRSAPKLENEIITVIHRIESLAIIDKIDRKNMDKIELQQCINTQKELSTECDDVIRSLSFLSPETKRPVAKKQTPDAAAHAVSQKEIFYLSESVRDRVKALDGLEYTRSSFGRIEECFDSAYSSAESGRKNEILDSVLKSRSLIAAVQDLSLKKIKNEASERKYLRKEIASDCAIINARLSSAKTVSPSLSNDELNNIQSMLKITPTVKIGGKVMTEYNISEIDRYAYQRIEAIYRQATWKKDAPMKQERITLKSKGIHFSILLPEGFSENKPSFNMNDQSIIKYYTDDGSERILYVALKPIEDKPDETLRMWISALGRTPIRKERPKIKNISFMATASYKNTVMDAYIIEDKGAYIIIAGECPKVKYGFFQGTVRTVASSVEFGN